MNRNEMAKTQREILGLSQRNLAEMIQAPQTYISKYENGDEVKPEVIEKIHAGLTSVRDKMYPENTYERQIYTLNLHCALFGKSETFNDKIEYCNKMMRDITFLIQFIMADKKKFESAQRSATWKKGYSWR